MRKFILLFLVSILLAGCFFPRHSKDDLTFNVQNNCTYPVTTFYERENLTKFVDNLAPNSRAHYMEGHTRKENESYEEKKEEHFDTTKSKISIIYPDGHEEIFTLKEFAAKADAQTGKDGRGSWTLTLCPDNENPPPPGEMIRPSPPSSY